MEFSKSRTTRFPLQRASEAPGPGAYNPMSPSDPQYKRGAMLEKAERWTENVDGTDTFGLYDVGDKENQRKRGGTTTVLGATNSNIRQQLEELRTRLAISHEKDLTKLHAKITKLESSREETVKDKNDVKSEVAQLKIEIRSAASRETALRSSLEKSDSSLARHLATLPAAQKKQDDLAKSNADALKRKEAEIIGMRKEIALLKKSLEGTQESSDEVLARAEEAETSLSELRDRLGEQEQYIEAQQATLSSTVLETSNYLASRAIITPLALESLQFDLHTCQLRSIRLERQLAASQAQSEALGKFSSELDEECDFLRESLFEVSDDLDRLLLERKEEREDRRSEKEWRQRTRSDARETASLREEVEVLSTFIAQERIFEVVMKEETLMRDEEIVEERRKIQSELEIVEGELDVAINETVPTLEGRLSEATTELAVALLDVGNLKSLLSEAETSLAELENSAGEALEMAQAENEELRRKWIEREKECEKLRGEKTKIASLLGLSRSAEKSLLEEVEQSRLRLSAFKNTEAQNETLSRTVDELYRKTAVAENNFRELAETHTDLLSHGNPNQKIRIVGHMREQLDDREQKLLSTTSNLATTLAENASLRAELESYRAVSPRLYASSTASTSSDLLPSSTMVPIASRSRVTRPSLLRKLDEEPQRIRFGGGSPPRAAPTPLGNAEDDEEQYELIGDEEMMDKRDEEVADGSASSLVRRGKSGREGYSSGSSGSARSTRSTGAGRSIAGGGVRMEGKMSVSELFG